MSNWCENILRVTGKPEEVQRFADEILGGGNPVDLPAKVMTEYGPKSFPLPEDAGFDFGRVVPYPSRFADRDVWRLYFEEQWRRKNLPTLAENAVAVEVAENKWQVMVPCVVGGRRLSFPLSGRILYSPQSDECLFSNPLRDPEPRFPGCDPSEAAKAMALEITRYTTGFVNGGHEWRMSAYGCRWGRVEEAYWRTDTFKNSIALILSFDTPWNPPSGVACALIEKYPALSFRLRFREDGNGLRGSVRGQRGRVAA